MHLTSSRGQYIAAFTAAPQLSQYQVQKIKARFIRIISLALAISLMLLGMFGLPSPGLALAPQTADTPTQLISYTASGEDIANPERGFYTDIDLINQTNFADLYNQGWRVVYAYIRLAGYRTQDLPASYLQQLEAGLGRVRTAGLKVIPRFSYTSEFGTAESEPDATLDQVLRHLDQIGSVFGRNADVILAVEAGFIGAWGEWHHSSNQLENEPARSTIFNALLAKMPASRPVQFRFPRDLKLHFPVAMDSSIAFNGSAQARAGLHNDCFLADYHDSGTWIPESDGNALKAYIAQIGQFAPVGGETCTNGGVGTREDCITAQNELAQYHWTYIDSNTPSRWTNDGCRGTIGQKLGYRLRLTQAELPTQLAAGQTFQGSFDVVNDGYAAPFNPRAAELILRNTSTGGVLTLPIATDPRRWLPGNTQHVVLNLTLPSNLVAGNYEYLLSLPDPALHDRLAYRIRLANSALWEASTGFNKLNGTVTVSGATGPNPTATPVVLPTTQPTQPPTATPAGQPASTATPRPATPTATATARPSVVPPTATPVGTAVPNRPPVANAGADVSGYFGWTMTLDGGQSRDPDSNPLTYNWTQIGGATVRLYSSATSAPTFTVPITPGALTFQLVVKDSAGLSSAADTVVVMVINRAPLAHAGYDRVTYPGWKVYLDGARSVDPDTHRLTGYTWTQVSGIGVVLSTTSVVSPLFTAPTTPGVLIFKLSVMDRFGLSSAVADTVVVTVANRAPLAHAGYDRVAATNRGVQLDGSRSTDPEKHKLVQYQWVQNGGQQVLLSNDGEISPTFSAPKSAGTLSFKLVVRDEFGMTTAVADSVLVTVTEPTAIQPDLGEGVLDYIEVAESEVPLMPEPEIEPEGFDVILGSEIPFGDGAVDLSGLREVYLPSLMRNPD